jgi:O-antigen/teichoic acid export membrane protein
MEIQQETLAVESVVRAGFFDRLRASIHQNSNKARGSLRSRFVRDGAMLAMGSIVSQSLAILTAPIMARLYDPEAYGLLGLFIAVYGILTVPAIMQYNQAVILPKEDRESLAIIKGGLLLGVIATVAVAILYLIPAVAIFRGTKYAPIVPWLPLMVMMVLPGCFTTFAMSWLARKQQFRALSIVRVCINITSTSVGMAIGFWQKNIWGLLIANAAGSCVGTAILIYAMKESSGLSFVKADWNLVKSQLLAYRDFPLFATPTQFIAQLSRQAPVLLLTGFGGQVAVGFFNMSNRLLGLPNVLFAESLSAVFHQRAAKEYAETAQCYELYKKVMIGMTIVVVPFLTLAAVIAPDLFAILLGERWRGAGEYSRILCWLFGFQLVCTPLMSMMVIAKRLREDLIVQLASALLLVVMMSLAFRIFGTITAVLVGYVLSSSAMYLYYGLRGLRLARGISAPFEPIERH